jgi:hypothetical protein
MTGGAFTAATRRRIAQRDDNSCVACGKVITGPYSIQHRKARGMGGTRRKVTCADGILVHGTGNTLCHGTIEANPDWARTMGYRVDQSADVLEVPVYVVGFGWRLLTADGQYAPVGVPA